ncbi:MAG: phage tail protein, partial [Lachnospiraceae bacterium]|nr:phage tail protein [Lachnospiraceae bacterium]
MANFKTTIITQKGHALIAKLEAGTATSNFKKICTSDYDYSSLSNSQLEKLTSIRDVKQTILPDKVSVINKSTVKVSGTLTNTELKTGYYIRTIALYAVDPDEGEILYSITPSTLSDFIPPNNGVTSSGVIIDLLTTVSNAENVSIDVDPNAIVSIQTFNDFKEEVNSQLNKNANEINNIITEYAKKTDVNDLASKKAEKNDLQTVSNELNVQKARIDAFTSLAQGSTTGDAELIDTRVGLIGETYPNSGTAVRTQLELFLQDCGLDYVDVPITNDNIHVGYISSSKGILVNDVAHHVDAIKLKKGETIKIYAEGYENNVAMISRLNPENGTYTPLVSCVDNVAKWYTYT